MNQVDREQREVEVRYEPHDGGGSIWVHVPTDPQWLCVWSTAYGNVNQRLDDVPSSIEAVGIQIPDAWL
jgi:hypothetical protein